MIDEQHEQTIIDYVNASKIRNTSLKDDLIDHLCCLVEINIDKGMNFETALQKAQLQTAPGGLNEIEKETIFLLNYSKIMLMKRMTYVVGYLFTVTWIAGMLMKLLHLPGAAVIMGIGAIGVVCIFLPILLINRYKHIASEVMSERMKWILGGISIALLIASMTMKMLHMMGSGLLLAISVLFFAFGFLPFLFFRMYRKSLDEL